MPEKYPNPGLEAMYGDESEPAAPAGETKTKYQPQVINSAICPGMNVGDTLELRIDEVRDGEYVVSYIEGEGEGGEGGGEPPAAEAMPGEAPAPEGIGAMME